MSEVSADQSVELLKALNDLYISRLFSGAAATLAIYDWIIVFNLDYLPITLVVAEGTILLYPANYTTWNYICGIRIVGSATGAVNHINRSCHVWAVIGFFGMLSSLFASSGLLTLRLVALYRRNKGMVWFIRTFFLASYLATLGLVISASATYNNSMYYSDLLKICATTASSKTISAIFYAPSAFELFVFSLTAFRAWKDAKIFTGASGAPFLVILYRDGLVSFCVMFSVRMWNVWIYTTAPTSSYSMGTPLMWAINTVLTTRVYMNLVWMAKRPIIEASELTGGFTGGIRLRVHTITEVHTDAWRHPRLDTRLGSIQESEGPSPYPSSQRISTLYAKA